MGVAQEGFAALAGPFHRAADALRGPGAHRLFRIDEDLGAEAPAHVRRDHPQLVLGREADEGGEDEPRHMGILAVVQRVKASSPASYSPMAARGSMGLGARRLLCREMRVTCAARAKAASVAALSPSPTHRPCCAGPRHGSARRPPPARGRDRPRPAARRNPLPRGGGVLGGVQRLRDHHGHMVAHIAHRIHGERGMGARLHGRAVLGVDHPAADEPAETVLREILPGEDGHHAGHGCGRCRVDARMRAWAWGERRK